MGSRKDSAIKVKIKRGIKVSSPLDVEQNEIINIHAPVNPAQRCFYNLGLTDDDILNVLKDGYYTRVTTSILYQVFAHKLKGLAEKSFKTYLRPVLAKLVSTGKLQCYQISNINYYVLPNSNLSKIFRDDVIHEGVVIPVTWARAVFPKMKVNNYYKELPSIKMSLMEYYNFKTPIPDKLVIRLVEKYECFKEEERIKSLTPSTNIRRAAKRGITSDWLVKQFGNDGLYSFEIIELLEKVYGLSNSVAMRYSRALIKELVHTKKIYTAAQSHRSKLYKLTTNNETIEDIKYDSSIVHEGIIITKNKILHIIQELGGREVADNPVLLNKHLKKLYNFNSLLSKGNIERCLQWRRAHLEYASFAGKNWLLQYEKALVAGVTSTLVLSLIKDEGSNVSEIARELLDNGVDRKLTTLRRYVHAHLMKLKDDGKVYEANKVGCTVTYKKFENIVHKDESDEIDTAKLNHKITHNKVSITKQTADIVSEECVFEIIKNTTNPISYETISKEIYEDTGRELYLTRINTLVHKRLRELLQANKIECAYEIKSLPFYRVVVKETVLDKIKKMFNK